MLKTFAFRLYPSKRQQGRLEAVLETARQFYNDCLAERKAIYETEHRTMGKAEQLRRVKVHKANNPSAAEIHSHVLQVVVADLHNAFAAFFRRVRRGQMPGYPRFKGKQRFRSFGFKEYGNGFKIDGRRLRLSGVGRVPIRWHRPLEGNIKAVRISRKAYRWYASFYCAVVPAPLPPKTNEIGMDAGLSSLFVLSTGQQVENPRWYRSSQRRLRTLQRRVARRKPGGANCLAPEVNRSQFSASTPLARAEIAKQGTQRPRRNGCRQPSRPGTD